MAGIYVVYYRNHDGSDSTHNNSYVSSSPCPTIDTFGWSAPSGKSFKEWNTSRDGSGTSMFPGETYSQIEGGRYAIWEDADPIEYLTNDQEITSIADAIRTKGGTSASLVYPTGFVSAINAISTGTDVSDTTAAASDVRTGKYFYTSAGVKTQGSLANGSATTPATSITANPSISVSSSGLITATTSASQSVTPTVSAGYVSSGTAGTVTVSGSNTSQLTTQAAQTITPTTSDQTIASGKYLTGTQTIKGDANLVAGNIKSGTTIFGVTGTYSGGGGGSGIKHAVYEWASSMDLFTYISGDVLSESEVNESYMTCIGSMGCLLMKTHDDSGYINYATVGGDLNNTDFEYEGYDLYFPYASEFSSYMQDGDRLDIFVLPSN